jgi:flavin reductase (DIM6/NTAB) family NADH-FMN oxidoreductase RutF
MSETPDYVDPGEFRAIMGSFPTGVAVVTVIDADGVPRGLTTNATCSVSADPPMLLVCVDKGSNTLPALQASESFVVNYLRQDSEEVAGRFASKAGDKFAGLEWMPGKCLQPVLAQASCAYAEARVAQRVEAGDHWILIAEVECGWVDPELRPLAYHRGAYQQLANYEGDLTR